MNPFAIPGMGGAARPPLCPWQEETAEHERLYVPVDSTATAFRTFQSDFGGSVDPTRQGRLVLVTGGTGCGKTSLINRCVNWLRGTLTGRVTIADVTKAAQENEDVDERMRRVCRHLLDLWVGGLVGSDEKELLSARCGDPLDFYAYLSAALPDEQVIIVLLPPSELAKEVNKYIALCSRKVVFFAESSYEQVRSAAEALRISGEYPLTWLTVHPLGKDDGRAFQAERMRRHHGDGPRFDEEAAELMVRARLKGRGISIGELQKLLYKAYAEAAAQENPHGIITFEDLTHYVVRWASLK